jgi:hypothetical protein
MPFPGLRAGAVAVPDIRYAGEWAVSESLRLAERLLPVPLLRLLLWPPAAILSAYELTPARRTYHLFGRLPPSLRPSVSRGRWLWRLWTRRTALVMTRFFRFWPDRLREPRWQSRCRVHGAERLNAVLDGGRPVILTALHYGCLTELYHCLRARGLTVASVSARGEARWSEYRKRLNTLADEANGLTGLPRVYEVGDVWSARDHLAKPRRLLTITLDGYHGQRPLVVRGPDFCLRLGSGAVRLAAVTNAVIVPCLIAAPRGLAVEIHFGTPVADDLIADPCRHPAAAEHVVRELLPLIRALPEQCVDQLLSAFDPG